MAPRALSLDGSQAALHARDLAALAALCDDVDGATLRAMVEAHGGVRAFLLATSAEHRAAGLGPRELRRLAAVHRLARALARPPRRRRVHGATDVAALLAPLAWRSREEVWVVATDGAGRVLGVLPIARGESASCAVSEREVLTCVLRLRARAFFVVHNHPSGDAQPSHADVLFTERLALAARQVGLTLEDHVVVGGRTYRAIVSRRRGTFAEGRAPPGVSAGSAAAR